LLNGVFWRALQIYAYYLIVSLTTILLITVSRDIIAIPDNHQDYIALTEDPLAAIQSAFFLVSPPDLPGVLVLYLELTLFFIPMFILIAAWNSAVALFVSGSLWLLAQIYPDLLAGLPIHSFVNPMAWQFIFCIGMYVGTWYNSDEISLETFHKRPWVLLACAVVGIGLLYKLARLFANNQLLDLGTLTMSDTALAQMKAKLSAIRRTFSASPSSWPFASNQAPQS
jgi:hypothetical protein